VDVHDAELTAVERRNAYKSTAGEGLFGAGMGFLSSVSVLPLLLKSLGASEVQIGLLGSIFWAGWLVLQPLGLFLFGRRVRTKRLLVPWSLASSVPTYLGIGLIVYLLAGANPKLCVALVLTVLAVRVIGGGMTIPFWWDWQALVFRRAIRGRAIGMLAASSPLGAALAALAAGKVVEALSSPGNYVLLAVVSVVFFVVALAIYWMVQEPESISTARAPTRAGDLFRRFGESVRDRNFRMYLVGRLLMTLGSGGAAFYALFFASDDGGGLAPSTVIKLSALLPLAQCIVSYPLGHIGDRAGHKIGVVVGAVCQVAAILVAWLSSGVYACGATFALIGAASAASWVSHVNMLFETCPHESRTAHITLSNMVLGPMLWLVPVLTGWLIGQIGLRAGIGIALVPTAAGILWLALAVREPRDVEMTRLRQEAVDGQFAPEAAS
jgi:MFS family permease